MKKCNGKRAAALVLFGGIAAACGGGGSSSSGMPLPAPPSSPPPAPNQPPVISAGMDQTVIEGDPVDLSGTASDQDGRIDSVEWEQLAGPVVTLVDPNRLFSGFSAPSFYLGDELRFRLTVRDDDGAAATDEVTIRLEPDFAVLHLSGRTVYVDRSFMIEPVEYYQLDIDQTVRLRLVLRSFLFNDDIEIYSERSLAPASLIARSVELGLENDTVYLEPGSPSPIYIRIVGGIGDQYTLTLREPSEFLEDGFPIDVTATAGTHQEGAESRPVTIGNIDADPELEILFSGVSRGPTYAFNHDGTPVSGWPVTVDNYTTYPSLGNLTGSAETLEIALGLGPSTASCHPDRYLLTSTGATMSGWPMTACNAGTTTPPALTDVDGDGIDEVFFSDRTGFYSDGQPLTGWQNGSTQFGQPAIADIDGDGREDFVYSTSTSVNDIVALDAEGNTLAGFPIVDDPGFSARRGGPIGLPDFDGDGIHEVVRIRVPNSLDQFVLVEAYAGNGNKLWETQTSSKPPYGAVPAFGDLNGDGLPELLIQTDSEVYAWHGDGSLVPGFPAIYSDPTRIGFPSASAPLIADVTGDGLANVVAGDGAFVVILDGAGIRQQTIQVPNTLMMAVADIDLDGRNEIVTAASQWNGHDFERHAGLWVLDLGGSRHGTVQWGQLGGGVRRHFSYPP